MSLIVAFFSEPGAKERWQKAWSGTEVQLSKLGFAEDQSHDDAGIRVWLAGSGCSAMAGQDYLGIIEGHLDSDVGANRDYAPSQAMSRLVASLRQKGHEAFSSNRGRFSAVIVDRATQSVWCARDSFGRSPLFVARMPGVVLTSSDIRAMRLLLGSYDALNKKALQRLLRFRFNVGSEHLFEPIIQVPAAHALRVDRHGIDIRRHWTIPFDPEADGSLQDWVNQTADAFGSFFQTEGLNDEPVGILLSGGVDSAVIAGMAKRHCREVKCYVARFPGYDDTEARRAVAVAERLEIPCEVVEFDETRIAQDLPRIVSAIGEPPLHPNNLVLLQLYEKASADDVKMVLQGDAAEMLFGLADTTRVAQFARKRAIAEALVPAALRFRIGHALKATNSSLLWRVARPLFTDLREFQLCLDEIYYSLPVKRIVHSAAPAFDAAHPWADLLDAYPDPGDGLQAYQAFTYLQASTDRHAVLARLSGTESVAPFLSESVLAVATALPRHLRYLGQARPVIKALCDQVAHPDVTRWPKLGFPVPWSEWLNGRLRNLLGTASEYEFLRDALPPGYLEAAWGTMDREALWFLMTLRILKEQPYASQRKEFCPEISSDGARIG